MAQEIAAESGARLHSVAACPTHAHMLLSFRDPPCPCRTAEHCQRTYRARQHADRLIVRWKQKTGQRMARDAGAAGRRRFSRGWNVTPVRNREHFDHPIAE